MATDTTNVGRAMEPFFTAEMLADPYPFYDRLRTAHPVYWVPALDAWLVTNYEEVSKALRNPQLSSDRFGRAKKRLSARGLDVAVDERVKSMIHMDAPDHTRLRGLVNKAFTPHIVEAMERNIQSIIDQLLDAVEGQGRTDLIQDLAYPLPITVIAEMLGVPSEDRARLKQWSDEIAVVLSGDISSLSQGVLDRAVKSRSELADYFSVVVRKRRAAPGDDLLTALVRAEEDGGRLTDDELYSTAILLLIAGNETTTNLIGNGLLALLRHPDQQSRVWDDAALIPLAVEEMLRYDSPVQLTTRLAKGDLAMRGMKIREGQWVYLMLGAANRDPAQFAEPDRFDIGRMNNKHIAFAAGPHFCLGAPLARLEAQLTLSTLRRRFPKLRLGSETLEYRQNFTLRGLKALPLVF